MISQKLLGVAGFLVLTTSLIAPHAFAQRKPQLSRSTGQSNGHIEWQKPTQQLIQAGGLYGRVARVNKKTVACIYERAGGVHLKISADNGKTWGTEIGVAEYEYGNAANPELLILPNGDWLCSFNQRPRNEPGKDAQPFAIATCRSVDRGKTWSAPQIIYRAGISGGVGCWEPRAIALPNGEVQLFFANEAPFPNSGEQEISRMVSRDNGKTWGEAKRASFRAGKRDGMPVPQMLRDGSALDLVMAIEDDGINGAFKPVIIMLDRDVNYWVDGDGKQHSNVAKNTLQDAKVVPTQVGRRGEPRKRWQALEGNPPLTAETYAGAPYLCQMPGKEDTTILSAQLSPDGNDRKARMAVWIGDGWARNFTDMSLPFGEENKASGLWNSVWAKDATTVNALSSTSIDGVFGLWSIDGIVKAE